MRSCGGYLRKEKTGSEKVFDHIEKRGARLAPSRNTEVSLPLRETKKCDFWRNTDSVKKVQLASFGVAQPTRADGISGAA